MRYIKWSLLTACAFVLVITLLVGATGTAARDTSSTVRIRTVTGTDGTENALMVELYGPAALYPFWRVTLAEMTGDLLPGMTNDFEFEVPVGFCDIVEFRMYKPASPVIGDDPWDIREVYVYVNDIPVAFDAVVWEYFSPQTVTSWPVNLNWQGTEAYQSRCTAVPPFDPGSSFQIPQLPPGIFAIINTPIFFPLRPDLIFPPRVTEEPPAPPDCGRFLLASPREGMANGAQPFYWEPAPDATSYQLNIYDEAGAWVFSLDIPAPSTSVTWNMSEEVIGPGIMFTVEILALRDGQTICADRVTQPRAVDVPQSFCGDGVCNGNETPNTCPTDCGCNNNKICEPQRGENANNCRDCP